MPNWRPPSAPLNTAVTLWHHIATSNFLLLHQCPSGGHLLQQSRLTLKPISSAIYWCMCWREETLVKAAPKHWGLRNGLSYGPSTLQNINLTQSQSRFQANVAMKLSAFAAFSPAQIARFAEPRARPLVILSVSPA